MYNVIFTYICYKIFQYIETKFDILQQKCLSGSLKHKKNKKRKNIYNLKKNDKKK